MNRFNSDLDNYQNENDNGSNLSFNNDDDTILTATITFDVTVDKDGQVINTSEGQIVSESVDTQRNADIANSHFNQKQLDQFHQYHELKNAPIEEDTSNNPIQADSLASITEHSQKRDKSILQDSLDEIDAGNETEEESTTTESLIERSKKYMDKEAGIIILRRNDDEPKNFNINLDFDIKEKEKEKIEQEKSIAEEKSVEEKDFNIDLDFNLKNGQKKLDQKSEHQEKDFNIDMDFDIKSDRKRRNNGKDGQSYNAIQSGEKDFDINMDFDLKSKSARKSELNSTVENEVKDFDINMDFELRDNVQNSSRFVNMDFETGVGIDVIITNKEDPDESILYEETIRYEELDDEEIQKINAQEENLEDYLRKEMVHYPRNKSKIISNSNLQEGVLNDSFLTNNNDNVKTSDRAMDGENFETDKARLDLINRMVEKSIEKGNVVDKEEFYRRNIDKVRDFNVEDCIEILLDGNDKKGSNVSDERLNQANSLPVLRPFETVDFEALTKGFEAEDVKEGTLVLYITESQLLQLLNQRAIIVPDKNTILSSLDQDKESMSLVDDKIRENLGRESPVNKVELVIEKEKAEESKKMSILDIISDVAKERGDDKDESHQTKREEIQETEKIYEKYEDELKNFVDERQVDKKSEEVETVNESNQFSKQTNISPWTTSEKVGDSFIIEKNAKSNVPIKKLDLEERVDDNSISTSTDIIDSSILLEPALASIEDKSKNDPITLNDKKSESLDSEKHIFDEFINNSIGNDLIEEIKKEKLEKKVYNKIQDLVDHVFSDVNRIQSDSSVSVEKAKLFDKFFKTVSSSDEESRNKEASDKSIKNAVQKISEVFDKAKYENYETEKRGSSSEKVLKTIGDFVNRMTNVSSNQRILTDSQSDEALDIIKNYALEGIGGTSILQEKIIFEEFLKKTLSKELLDELKSKKLDGKAYNLIADFCENIIDDIKQKDSISFFTHPALEKGKTFEKFYHYISNKPENLSNIRQNLASHGELLSVKTKIANLYDLSISELGKKSINQQESISEKNLKFLGDFVERVLDNRKSERLFNDKFSDTGLKEVKYFVLSALNYSDMDSKDEISQSSQLTSQSSKTSLSLSDKPESRIFDEFLHNIFGSEAIEKLEEKGLLVRAYNLIQDIIDYSIFDVVGKVNSIDSITERGLIFKNFFENIASRSRNVNMVRKRIATDECFQMALNSISKVIEESSNLTESHKKSTQTEKVMTVLGDFVNRALGSPNRLLSDSESDLALSNIREYVFNCLCDDIPTSKRDFVFEKFLEDIFGQDSLKKLINSNLINRVNNKIQDLIDDSFSHAESGIIDQCTFDKANIFKNYVIKQGPKYSKNFDRRRTSCDAGTKKAMKDIADVFDKSSKLTEMDKALSPAGKTVKTLADFTDRVLEQPDRLLSDDLSKEAMSKITDYVLNNLCDEPAPSLSITRNSIEPNKSLDNPTSVKTTSRSLSTIKRANVSSNVKTPSEANVSSNVKASSEANVSSDVRAPSEANVSSDVRAPSEANVSSDVRAPSEASVSSNVRTPSKLRISSDTRVKSEARMLPDSKIPSEARTSSVRSSYRNVVSVSPTSGKFPDSEIISFKDFDLLVPGENRGASVSSGSVDYISSGDTRKNSIAQSYTTLPRQYEFLNPTKSSKKSEFIPKYASDEKAPPRKIVIKTTKKIPPVICPPVDKNAKYVKKRITYSYLDNYTPSTRIYELMDYDLENLSEETKKLLSMESTNGHSLKPFDSAILNGIGKPTVEQINDYLSVINTGVDQNADLIQIHPLLNSSSKISYQDGSKEQKETKNYFGDTDSQFKGLRITDFPLYVQGLEFRQNTENAENDPQSVILSHGRENSRGINTDMGVQSELFTKQVVNNVDNVQYVKVNSEKHIKSAQ